ELHKGRLGLYSVQEGADGITERKVRPRARATRAPRRQPGSLEGRAGGGKQTRPRPRRGNDGNRAGKAPPLQCLGMNPGTEKNMPDRGLSVRQPEVLHYGWR